MELAELEPATSWVRSVGDQGLRGTPGDGLAIWLGPVGPPFRHSPLAYSPIAHQPQGAPETGTRVLLDPCCNELSHEAHEQKYDPNDAHAACRRVAIHCE